MLEVSRWHLDTVYSNYNYLVFDSETREALAVDPFDASVLEQKLQQKHLKLIAVLITHEHLDHYYGLSDVLTKHPHITVYAHVSNKNKIAGVTHFLSGGDKVNVNEKLVFETIYTPGHINGHISAYFPAINSLFCGDTLFNAGAGNVKHKSADVEKLYQSIETLKQLPESVKIYSGHDYFIRNVEFSKSVLPDKQYDQLLEVLSGQTPDSRSVATLKDELEYNLFLNSDKESVKERVQRKLEKPLTSSLEVFKGLRHLRDQW